MQWRFFTVICCLAFGGCVMGPDYHRPDMHLPEYFSGAGTQWHVARVTDRIDRGAWWLMFADPELDRLEKLSLQQNTTLAIAVAQRDQAVAQLAAVRASLGPTLGFTAQQQHNHSYFLAQANHSVGFQASWEPDFWGLARRAIEQQGAAEQSVEAQMASVRLSTTAQVAQTYFSLLQVHERTRLDQHAVDLSERLLDLTRAQEQAGTVSHAAVLQVMAQLDNAKSQWQQDLWQGEQLVHALAVECGQLATGFVLHLGQWPRLPDIPKGIPADILLQRPDVAAAERSVAAANAGIGLAEIAYFPTVTLAANISWQSNKWGDWIRAPNRYWSLGPTLAETLFDGGKRAAQVRQAKAAWRQSVATYRGQVLTAVQEVEDDLSAINGLAQQSARTRVAVQTMLDNEHVTYNQVQAGTASDIDLLNGQLSVLSEQQLDLAVQAQRYLNTVFLVQSLGGGWSTKGS